MRSQVVIGEILNILIMLFILSGVFAIFSAIDLKVDRYTTEKKMDLILNKIEYQSLELCYESQLYNSTVGRWVYLPSSINFHKYGIMGNGTSIRIICNGMSLSRNLNATGSAYGNGIRITCENNKIKIE